MRPSTHPPIRTVLFDVGGTLVRVRPSVGMVYAGAARDHGFDVSAEALDRNFRAAWRRSVERGHSRGHSCSDEILREEWSTVVRETFKESVPAHKMPALFDDLYDRFASATVWELAPRVKEHLEHLRAAGIRLGVLSNWDSRLRSMLEELGLRNAFDFLVISYDVGVEKPHPDIFQAAVDRGGSSPSETLLVGDSYEADIEAASRCGLATIWITSRAEHEAKSSRVDVGPWIESFPHDTAAFWRGWIV